MFAITINLYYENSGERKSKAEKNDEEESERYIYHLSYHCQSLSCRILYQTGLFVVRNFQQTFPADQRKIFILCKEPYSLTSCQNRRTQLFSSIISNSNQSILTSCWLFLTSMIELYLIIRYKLVATALDGLCSVKVLLKLVCKWFGKSLVLIPTF